MKGWDHHQFYVFPHVLREEHSAQVVQQEHAADTYDLYCFILSSLVYTALFNATPPDVNDAHDRRLPSQIE